MAIYIYRSMVYICWLGLHEMYQMYARPLNRATNCKRTFYVDDVGVCSEACAINDSIKKNQHNTKDPLPIPPALLSMMIPTAQTSNCRALYK